MQPFARTEVECHYGWLADAFSDPNVIVRFERRPAIMAVSVTTEDGKDLVNNKPMSVTAGDIANGRPTRFHRQIVRREFEWFPEAFKDPNVIVRSSNDPRSWRSQ